MKPVEGADGNRVPLLRPGFRPADSYSISFVFLHSGSPFAKKGGAELALPKMDIPVGLLEWEVFLPSQYTIANFGGNALQARLLPAAAAEQLGEETTPGAFNASIPSDAFGPVRLSGHIVDTSGAAIQGTNILVRHLGTGVEYRAVTNLSGQFEVHGLPSGRVRITATHAGFVTQTREVDFDASRGLRVSFPLQVGSVTETVEVSASNARVETKQIEQSLRQNAASKEDTAASSNVIDLQRRVVGVLPIAVKVPRTGNAYRFARPLVMDEETKLTFNYKTK